MEFPIKVMIIVMIAFISFLLIAALMGGWGSQTSDFITALFQFFQGIIG